ncbi:UDP-N-acetylmuramoyl-L-alanyl-D-glutamate--2,6-diaminopimelate ligase [Antrihabitans cavernicola]|nr:UDP-N-acetylmuramoyl-L-alanyl-D-glutamate--2,6-diaminopimelate ligase [Spelaeibacter cavernicola]
MTTVREVAALLGDSSLVSQIESSLTGISQDSRTAQPGDLYVALSGSRHHGIDFADEAKRNGAVAILSDRDSHTLPTIVVADPRRVLGPLASWFHHHPSRALDVYGVTGTNGKTSTAYLIDAGLRAAGVTSGLITGVEVRGRGEPRRAVRTTPEASDLQQILATFAAQRLSAVAMEVSSHALALYRTAGTHFGVGVFTNLDRDHLDFHADMDAYYSAKASLFTPGRCDSAVIGTDDEFGRRLAAEVDVPSTTFSTSDAGADFFVDDVRADRAGTSFTLRCDLGTLPVRLRLLGHHQADNAAAAIAALYAGGVDVPSAIDGIEKLDLVPGRLQPVDEGQPFVALVDYVHNTAGQRRLFPYLRSLTSGRVIVVMGATGERDPGKRDPLGFNAARQADVVIVTDESPHFDAAYDLREEVASGARRARSAEVMTVADRAEAIATAVARATPGDVVVIAGRGHDPVQVHGNVETPFDDRAALKSALRQRQSVAPSWSSEG